MRCRPFAVLWLFFCLVAPSAFSKDYWIEVRSPHFIVISNASDKEARKIADHFEQFREVFHTTFPNWRLDLGKPLIIFAVRNEDSLRTLLPAYWEQKGHAHPAGFYLPGEERHYVALRTDVETGNPYQIVYHEYTHAIINLNFRGLPVWLNEGLAEFYANSVIEDKDIEIGRIAPYHLRILQTERLIPIDVLFTANESSPYYNEANHASMFYAESWAITHYFMMDPQASQQHLLANFLRDWDDSGDAVRSAQKNFGDLKKFAFAMDGYARQRTFYYRKITTTIHSDTKSFTSRPVPPAELEAQRALFYAHSQRPKEAMAAVDEAIKDDPKLPLAYEAQGFLAYSQGEFQPAEASFHRAIELGSTDFFPYYFVAEAELRTGMPLPEDVPRVAAPLEKAIQINPEFAPAYAALATVYSINPDTHQKAFADGRKAVALEPGNLFYAVSFGYVLANAGKTADAKALALRIQQAAKSPVDRGNVQQLLNAIAMREQYEQQVASREAVQVQQTPAVVVTARPANEAESTEHSIPVPSSDTATSEPTNPHAGESEYAVEGNIASADCATGPGKLSLSIGKFSMNFRFADFSALQLLTSAKQDAGQAPACSSWKGRHVRLYFYKLKDQHFTGELNSVQFL
jgi:Tfp pilus assembly protein PilF